jgi:hypothetical protein
MGIIVPPGYKNVAYRFKLTGDNEEMIISIGVSIDSLLDGPTTAQTAYDAGAGPGSPFAGSNMLPSWQFTGTTVTEMTGTGALISEHAGTVIGTATGGSLPVNCALLVRKNTAQGGRMHRGRMYVPPFSIAEAGVNTLGDLPEGLAELQADWNLFYTALVSQDLEPVLFHSVVGVAPTPITSFTVDGKIATQRRRLR